MSLMVIGAGYGRTGTDSLKVALEHLYGGTCYHMKEVIDPRNTAQHVAFWTAAIEGKPVDYHTFLKSYVAAVDWPAAHFWRELMEQYPEAKVRLLCEYTVPLCVLLLRL